MLNVKCDVICVTSNKYIRLLLFVTEDIIVIIIKINNNIKVCNNDIKSNNTQ